MFFTIPNAPRKNYTTPEKWPSRKRCLIWPRGALDPERCPEQRVNMKCAIRNYPPGKIQRHGIISPNTPNRQKYPPSVRIGRALQYSYASLMVGTLLISPYRYSLSHPFPRRGSALAGALASGVVDGSIEVGSGLVSSDESTALPSRIRP